MFAAYEKQHFRDCPATFAVVNLLSFHSLTTKSVKDMARQVIDNFYSVFSVKQVPLFDHYTSVVLNNVTVIFGLFSHDNFIL